MSPIATPASHIDEEVLKNHVIIPLHIVGVTTERGPLQLVPPPVQFPGPSPLPIPIPVFPPPSLFHGDGFCAALHAVLTNSTNGYVMQMQHHGKTVYTQQFGMAQTAADGSVGWTPQVPMHVASLSKILTGMAMTKALDVKGISYDASIAPYLPSYWVQGPNIGTVTFRQLMTHSSGFTSSGADFLSVKAQVATGVPLAKVAHYENSNFSLCRVLLPVVLGDLKADASFPAYADENWDRRTRDAYESYVHDTIIVPAGSVSTLTRPAGSALAYDYPPSGPGWNSGDLASVSGAAGWHLSVAQLLKIMGAFRRGNTIFTPVQAQQLLDNMFGIDWKVARPLDGAFIYTKNGEWRNGARVEQGIAFYLPEDMELVVFVNSPIAAANSFLESVVLNTYTANIY